MSSSSTAGLGTEREIVVSDVIQRLAAIEELV
jgi:hypothetical protein